MLHVRPNCHLYSKAFAELYKIPEQLPRSSTCECGLLTYVLGMGSSFATSAAVGEVLFLICLGPGLLDPLAVQVRFRGSAISGDAGK